MTSTTETRTLIRALEEFHRLDPDITLPSILTFLYVNERDGLSENQSYCQDRLGMSMATVSRAVSHWAEYKRPRVDGLNMIESIPDPEDRRYKIVTLKRSGLEFVQKVIGAMKHGKQEGQQVPS